MTQDSVATVARRFVDVAERHGGVVVGRLAYRGQSGQWNACAEVRATQPAQRELLQVYLKQIGVRTAEAML